MENGVQEEPTAPLIRILDVRDWMLSLYEEKCSPLLQKLSFNIIPELCPQFGKYYKSLLDDCEKKMYELRTFTVNVCIAGFNNHGKNALCNHLIKRCILSSMDKNKDKSIHVPFTFQSGPVSQHNNARIQFKNDSTISFTLKTAESSIQSWDEVTASNWMRYKGKIMELYERRFEGVTYRALSNDDVAMLSRQPSFVKQPLLSRITLITSILGISRFGMNVSESTILSSSSADYEHYFNKAHIIVMVLDEPKEQLLGQNTLNACMQQKINGKDIIFVLDKKYDSDTHINSQFNFMAAAFSKCNIFGGEKIHLLNFGEANANEDRNFIPFERQLAGKIAEQLKTTLIECVEKFFQLVSCAEKLLTRFVSSFSAIDILDKIDFSTNLSLEDDIEEKISQAEKKLNKELQSLKKSTRKFLAEYIKDMVPYLEIHADQCKVKKRDVSEIRREILMSLNTKFRTNFEAMFLEWVHVKRAWFTECMTTLLGPIMDFIQLEVGRNAPPSPYFLLKYAANLLQNQDQQSDDLKLTVASGGIVLSDSLVQIQVENIAVLAGDEQATRRAAYMEFLVHLMRIQADKQVIDALSTGAFGLCYILKEYMMGNIKARFASIRALSRVLDPSNSQVDYEMLCKVLYLRDDIVRHLKQYNAILYSAGEFPTLTRMKALVSGYSFADPDMCAMCLKKYTRCSHLCASCSVDLKGKPCPFCNKWSHFSSELNGTVSNMGNFILNLSRSELSPASQWSSSPNNKSQVYSAISKNGKVIAEFQHWFTEILTRNDFTSTKATEVFTCFVNAIISKHTPPDARNLPEQYQKIMMKCVSELFTDDFFPGILRVFKKEYQDQDITLSAKMKLFKHLKASSYIKESSDAHVLDEIDLFKAVVEFNKIPSCTRPYDKCEKVLKSAEIITSMFSQVRILMGADLFLPCIVFVLVQSNMEHPVSEFLFLCHFMETHCAHFEQYILQTFYSVIVSAPALLDQMLLEINQANSS